MSTRPGRLRGPFPHSTSFAPRRTECAARTVTLHAACRRSASAMAAALAVLHDYPRARDERVPRLGPHLPRAAVPDLLDGTHRECDACCRIRDAITHH